MQLRRIMNGIAALALALTALAPTRTFAADTLVRNDSGTNRVSIKSIESEYIDGIVKGKIVIQNTSAESIAGATLQITLDQFPDGEIAQRLASQVHPDPITLATQKQLSINFDFSKEALSGLRNGKLVTSAIVRSTGGTAIAFDAHFQTLTGLAVLQDVQIAARSSKLIIDGEDKARFDMVEVAAGSKISLFTELKNKSTTAASLTPFVTLYRTREAFNRDPLSETAYDSVGVPAGGSIGNTLEITAPSAGGTYIYYVVYKDANGTAITTRESYQIVVPGASTSIAALSAGEAKSTWMFGYTVPINLSVAGPHTDTTFEDIEATISLVDEEGTVISTATKALAAIGREGLTETIVLQLGRTDVSKDLSVKVVLSSNGETVDTLTTPISTAVDTAGFRTKLAVLGGSLLALLVLIIGLSVLVSKRRSKARHYIPLMAIAFFGFFLGFSTVKAENLSWDPTLIKGGGATSLENGSGAQVGTYDGNPVHGCLEVVHTPTPHDVTWAPYDWDDPDTEPSPDYKGIECDSNSTTSGGFDEPVACQPVPFDELRQSNPVPKQRDPYVPSQTVSGLFTSTRDHQLAPFSEPVNGVSSQYPGPMRPLFECDGGVDGEGGMMFFADCEGWYPVIVYVDVAFDPGSSGDTIPGISYFYTFEGDLAIDTMDYEQPGCQEGDVMNCTYRWIYPPNPCDPGGPGNGTSSDESGTSTSSGVSSVGSGPSGDGSGISVDGSGPSGDGSGPSGDGSGISVDGSGPSGDGSSPSTDGSSPSTDGSSPSTDGSSPSTDGSSPSTDGSSPSTDGSSPSTDGSSPSTDGSSPGSTGGSGNVLNFGGGSRRWQ